MENEMNTAAKKTEEETAVVPFSAQLVWDTLSDIDVTEHTKTLPKTDKRPEVIYLPWHKGWMLLKREFPASTYEHQQDLHHLDGTVEVSVEILIRREMDDVPVPTNANLPVMDARFNPIQNPDARQINDSRQRVIVKAEAFAGLGLSLWSDTPLTPVGRLDDPINAKQVKIIEELLEASGSDVALFLEWAEVDTVAEIPRERYRSARTLLEARVQGSKP
jgi:hypothetical protein